MAPKQTFKLPMEKPWKIFTLLSLGHRKHISFKMKTLRQTRGWDRKASVQHRNRLVLKNLRRSTPASGTGGFPSSLLGKEKGYT